MKATPQVNGPLDLLSGTGTNSSISSLDPTVVDILKNDFGFKLNGKSLDTRSADASGSQGRESDEVSSIDVFEPAQESAFQSFIGGAKHEMGFLDRCLILLKAIISGDYGFEVAKQILGKLIQIGRANQTSDNPGFLKAAFGAIALPENKDNVAHNIKHLLRLSKGKIQTRDIIDEFKKIGNVDSRIEFLGKLKEKLSEKEKTEFKDFLTETLDGIADQIADEFNNSQSIDKNALLSKLKSVDLLKTALLAKVKVGVPSLVRLVNDNKLKVSELSIDNAIAVANALLECGVNGLDRLAELINGNKLPDFISGHNSSARKRIACDLLSRGPSGLAVVKAFIKAGKLKPKQFEAQDAKEFVDALLKCGLSGADYVLELIDSSKLTGLESTDEAKTRASQFKELYLTFERGITKAFLGKTPNAGDKPWKAIQSRLDDLTLREACGIWQTIANEVAASCFDKDGKVDIEKLKGWMAFLGHKEIFKKPPYCFIPNAELMRSQMHTVCESLLNNKNKERDLLNAAKGITVGTQGQAILATMSKGRTPSLTPAVAILSSLFTPHRQKSLPTGTIDSLINAEIRNHPERLIKMYVQMLESDQFTLPSGHAIQQQEIVGSFITVDLKNGGNGKDRVFEDIISRDPNKIKRRKYQWLDEGMKYPGSLNNQADRYKLRLPIHNMNDILFANFFQASNFGNKDMDGDGNYGTMLLYAGHKESSKIFSPEIDMGGLNFLDGMTKLKEQAKAQQQLGNHYMRVGTKAKNGTTVDGNTHLCHAENIDINALLSLDLNNMETGRAYPIGDRNWCGITISQPYDIPRLAIRKVNNTPTYEFGTLWGDLNLKKLIWRDLRFIPTFKNYNQNEFCSIKTIGGMKRKSPARMAKLRRQKEEKSCGQSS